ncbi:MAG: GyrI-like domain-containing protein [Phycisphaeraceae bacterium]|nr:GyrI-like domain-containing protein [Phycisphaeraceae bacterium]
MNVTVKTLEPIRVAFVRHMGPYNEVGKAWETVCMYLGKEGLLGPDAQFIGVCYDNPEVTPADKIRYDACITVAPEFQGEGPVGVQVLAGGAYGVTTHEGPYHKLNETYAKLYGQWLPQSTYDLRNEPSLEFYLNDPNSTSPEDLLTDIYTPITHVK